MRDAVHVVGSLCKECPILGGWWDSREGYGTLWTIGEVVYTDVDIELRYRRSVSSALDVSHK